MATSASKAAPQSGPKAVPSPGAGDAPPAPGRFTKKFFLIAGALLLAVIGGGGSAWYYYFDAFNGGSGAAARQAPKPPVFMTMETFTVNLQTEDIQQFLQVGMTLQVTDQDQADLIKLHMPQARSRLLLLLSSKKSSEILSVEGKTRLAADILAQLRRPFTPNGPQPGVTDVFFTSFVVQ